MKGKERDKQTDRQTNRKTERNIALKDHEDVHFVT